MVPKRGEEIVIVPPEHQEVCSRADTSIKTQQDIFCSDSLLRLETYDTSNQ